MDLNYLRRLVRIFDESSASELMIDEKGIKIQLSRNNGVANTSAQSVTPHFPQYVQTPVMTQQVVSANESSVKPEAQAVAEKSGFHNVNSPIVGTFYRSPSPDTSSFVEVGDKVKPGTTLCIIEAMKLMNEIECDIAGTIEEIFVQNGQPVEYGQPIFCIKPD